MIKSTLGHTFHIPVMGIGFTIDTPLKVAHYGISSAISLGDDGLMERMRKFYCKKFQLHFHPISQGVDLRAKRITAYLNLIDKLVKDKFADIKKSFFKNKEIKKYLELLPEYSRLKEEYENICREKDDHKANQWFEKNLRIGAIDVNVMTKVDRTNFYKNKTLPIEYNDAHAAIRGFARSRLTSSVILSAGMNPRLYSYLANFEDFYIDENEHFNKKIILKVSDYRSALIQGKFLARKGLWVSEFRVESGLNCGGHVFPSDGHLLGPILTEFKENKTSLIGILYETYVDALRRKDLFVPQSIPEIRITTQGGVGTAEEHRFLMEHFDLDSVGWGTPFLLVPEATNVDSVTVDLLKDAGEDDLYLSDISPLGVRFHSLKKNTKELERIELEDKQRPGSPCKKKYLALNTEYSEKGLCTASREYQNLKIKELKDEGLNPDEYEVRYSKIVAKTCLCTGLGTSALLVNKMDTKIEGTGVSICPGPNMSYFSEIVSLKGMVNHIYGKRNILKGDRRPNLFIKEFTLYLDLIQERINDLRQSFGQKEFKRLIGFWRNLSEGITYYKNMTTTTELKVNEGWDRFLQDLEQLRIQLKEVRVTCDLIGDDLDGQTIKD